MTAEPRLGELLPSVNHAIDGVMRRRRRSKDFADDFRGWVMLKMLERDGAVLRKFRGESTLCTYLRVVVDRLYCDYLISLNGKWRSSKKARNLGTTSVQLERLIYLDGYTLSEAIAILQTRDRSAVESELRDRFIHIPARRRRSFVNLDSMSEPSSDLQFSADANLRRLEREGSSRSVAAALAGSFAELPEEDRLILELRFGQGVSLAEASRRLGLGQRSVYTRCHRILRVLREKLEARGVDRHCAGEVTESSVGRGIEGVFSSRSDCHDAMKTTAREGSEKVASVAVAIPAGRRDRLPQPVSLAQGWHYQ